MWWALFACTRTVPEPHGPLGGGAANPFPQTGQLDERGHLALRDIPGSFDTPLDLDSLSFRRGFSPAQVAVLRWPGLDGAALPTFEAPSAEGGDVRLIDLATGSGFPCFAELDATGGEDPALLVRPLTALPYDSDIAVVVTTDVMPRPDAFVADGEVTGPLLERLEQIGIDPDIIAVAWSFPVADGTAPLRSALDQSAVIGAPTLRVEAEPGERSLTYRAFTGTFPVLDFVGEGGRLDVADDGTVSVVGQTDAAMFVHVPESVADAEAASVPVLVFGHGIFASPESYLTSPDDGDGVRALADELGAIVVATTWRGLTTSDLAVALEASRDFGQFPRVPDLLVQGHANLWTLIEGIRRGGFTDDPAFEGSSGQSLPDPDRVAYYGISLGAIEGAVAWALDADLDAAALHVGGGMWSTMLERSSNWALLERGISDQIPDPADRQVLYAVTQLWWDAVDPMSYAEALGRRPFLLQISVGDEQVPNFTSLALARAAALPVAEPAPLASFGIELAPTPVPAPGRALVWFDPELGEPAPDNRPATVTGAHTAPRLWDAARRQVVAYLDGGEPGPIVHECGSEPCTAQNAAP